MSFTLQQKRGLYWGLSILAMVILVGVAWAQIAHALTQCFQPF